MCQPQHWQRSLKCFTTLLEYLPFCSLQQSVVYDKRTRTATARGKGMLSRKIRYFMHGEHYLHNWIECSKRFKQFILIIIVSLFCFFKENTWTRDLRRRFLCLKLTINLRNALGKFILKRESSNGIFCSMCPNLSRLSMRTELYEQWEPPHPISISSHALPDKIKWWQKETC